MGALNGEAGLAVKHLFVQMLTPENTTTVPLAPAFGYHSGLTCPNKPEPNSQDIQQHG